jgi:hypothetical protein
MKRKLFVLLVIATLVLSFGTAFAGGGSAPNFGITTDRIKLGEDSDTWNSGMHGLIVNGTNVYAIREGGLFAETEIVMDKSGDNGLTWLNSTGIAVGSDISNYGSAIAIDPVTKSLHYTWSTNSGNVYYSNGTITTQVNGSVGISGSKGKPIAIDGNGDIYIVFPGPSSQLYLTSSSDNGQTFSTPAAITAGDWFSFAADSAGNLFLTYLHNDGGWKLKFTKKLVSGSWSTPAVICSTCSDDPSMVVYDSNRIYVGCGSTIVATSNGGTDWTQYTAPGGSNSVSLAVDSNGLLNYAWDGTYGVNFARTTKSHDPSSWGQVALAIEGGDLPNVAVDADGKAYIMATDAGINTAFFTREE